MTTVALLRTTYLNKYLRRAELDTTPWTDAEATQAISDAIAQLWVDEIGKFTSGTAATSQASDVYTIPAALQAGRISRIELEQTGGGVTARIDTITNWRKQSATEVRIRPLLPTSSALLLRFFGWIPFLADASDLPAILESVVAMKAAALAYGQELGQLANSQLQQGLDSGRVVDYPTAVGMSAYWERRYQDMIERMPDYRVSYAIRRASRL